MSMILDSEYIMLSSLAYCYFSKKDIGYSLNELLIDEGPDLFKNKRRILLQNTLFKKMNYFDNWKVVEQEYQSLFQNWKILEIMDSTNNNILEKKPTGFYAIAFGKLDSEKNISTIVVAFRGSELFPINEAFKDFIETDFLIGIAKKPKQFDQGLLFYKDLIDKYNYKMIELTGHSLGGGIAQYVAVMSETITKDKDYIPKTFTINGIGILSLGFIEISYFFEYEHDLLENLYLKRLFRKNLNNIKKIAIQYILTRCPYIKNPYSFKVLPDSQEKFDYSLSGLELKFLIKSVKLVLNNKNCNENDIELLLEFLFNKKRLFKYFTRAASFLNDFYENKKYTNIKNYVHSKDFTASFYPHIGQTFEVDKRLRMRENVPKTDFFNQLNRLSIIIEKYHMIDVFVPFLATIGGRNCENNIIRGNFSDEINEQYISSALRKLIYLEKNIEKRLLVYYYSSKRNLGVHDIEFIRKTFLKVLKETAPKYIKYSDIIFEKLECADNETIRRIWFDCLDRTVSPYKCLDINDIMVYHYN